jgi:hypothetical protein
MKARLIGWLTVLGASAALAAPPAVAPPQPPGGMLAPGGVGGQIAPGGIGGAWAPGQGNFMGPVLPGAAFTNGAPGGQLYFPPNRSGTSSNVIPPPGGFLQTNGSGGRNVIVSGGLTNGASQLPGGTVQGGVLVGGGSTGAPGGTLAPGTGGVLTNGAAPRQRVIVTGGR